MNIFSKVLQREFEPTVRLGNPLYVGTGQFLARMNAMAEFSRGNGFRMPKKSPRVDAQGRTRGQRRRAVYASLFLA